MTTKLALYGSLARAFYYQAYRRSLERRAALQSLGVINRFIADVYEWWHA